MDDFILTGPDSRNLKMAYTRLGKVMKDRFGLELKPARVVRWCEKAPDIMGYVIHSDGTITIRPRNYLKARRIYTRVGNRSTISLEQAHLVVSYNGFFKNSDCKEESKKLKVEEITNRAKRLISDYDTGRLFQCIPSLSSIPVSPLPSPGS